MLLKIGDLAEYILGVANCLIEIKADFECRKKNCLSNKFQSFELLSRICSLGIFSIIVTEIELASFTRGHNLLGFSPDSNTSSFLFSEYRTDVIRYQQIIYVFRIREGLLER